jgi:hypothetical protein
VDMSGLFIARRRLCTIPKIETMSTPQRGHATHDTAAGWHVHATAWT